MRFKLNFFLFILVTVVLVVASIFSVITLRSELEARFEARKQDISEKLRVNLAQALWNFDEHQAENVIDAELGSQDVLAIRVFDEGERLFLEKFRDGASSVQAKDVARVQLHWHVEAVEKPLFGGILDKEMARFHRAISVSGFAD